MICLKEFESNKTYFTQKSYEFFLIDQLAVKMIIFFLSKKGTGAGTTSAIALV